MHEMIAPLKQQVIVPGPEIGAQSWRLIFTAPRLQRVESVSRTLWAMVEDQQRISTMISTIMCQP
ncbi:hypothetical protein [Mesorhizobium sp. M0047]|uniref:hypothetical protein n=1 Tax=Mesorhizobium sp. M0047 TaxID=2956859 RepID=UPI003335D374